jgi:HEAT repeat protein
MMLRKLTARLTRSSAPAIQDQTTQVQHMSHDECALTAGRWFSLRPGSFPLMICVMAMVVCGGIVSHALGLQPTGQPATAPAPADDLPPNPLLKEPETALDLFKSALLMTDYGRLDLATKYFDQLNSMEVSDEDLLTIRKKYGSGEIVRLINTPETHTAALKLSVRLNEAAMRQALDPEYTQQLISQLWEAPRIRDAAILDLVRLGKIALPQVLKTWQQDADIDHKTLLQRVMVAMGPLVIDALKGALTSTDDDLQSMVLDTLGRIGDQRAVHDILYFAVSPNMPMGTQDAAKLALTRIYQDPQLVITQSEALKIMLTSAKLHFQRKFVWDKNEQGLVEFWTYTDEAGLQMNLVKPDVASLQTGLRLSREGLEIDPSSVEFQTLYLSYRLAIETLTAGYGNPLPTGEGTTWDMLMMAGPERMMRVLETSLELDRPEAALPAIKALGQTGDKNLLLSSNSSMIEALNFGDERVQFAAAMALLNTSSETRFKGSSRITEILNQTLLEKSQPQAIIADPNFNRAITYAYAFKSYGYDAEIAKSGKLAFKKCVEESNYELVVMHANLIDWELSQTIANFRSDARTKYLPIIILAPEHLKTKYLRLTQNDPLTAFVIETTQTQYLKSEVVPFLNSLHTPTLSQSEKHDRKQQALDVVLKLSEQSQPMYPLNELQHALINVSDNPEFMDEATTILSRIGTPGCQEKLAALVLSPALPMEARQKAASDLTQSIRKFRVLLSRKTVDSLKQNWINEADQELRSLLSAVIGMFPTDSLAIGERMLQKCSPQILTSN